MNDFTYQKDNNLSLEVFEWDNIWWEHTENSSSKRVLYIGDSISCGVRRIATETAENNILFDGFGTSKALDNAYFKQSLLCCLNQQQHRNAVIFNNGLHGWHLSDLEYEENYRQMIDWLINTVDKPIIIVLTTNIANDDEKNMCVIRRNKIASALAKEYKLPVIDLYTVSERYNDLHTDDGVHFTEIGYQQLANEVVNELKKTCL